MEDVEKVLPKSNKPDKNARLANMLIKQLKSGELTLKEYFMQCAYWGLKTLDDMYFKSLPSKPMVVVEYEQLSYSEKKSEDNPGVMRYYEERDKVIRSNKDDLYWLEEYKKHIPESDVKNYEKLDKKINNFKMKMEDH